MPTVELTYPTGLIQPLLVEARSWFDGVTQKLYDEFAQRTSTSNPPRNEDELQIWLVAAMKHPETGLHIRLRRKILAEAGVDLNSFRITCMVEVWLCWAGKNRCLDWNTHVDLSPNCKLSLAGEFKYIPRPWNKELGKSDNPSAKYAISAVPWLTKDHRTEFLPAKDEIVDGRKWSLAEPKLDGEIDYSPPDEDRVRPSLSNERRANRSLISSFGRAFRVHSFRLVSSVSLLTKRSNMRSITMTGISWT